jgi:FKBP-type peptidyl-prolyl cis-trans isomerase FklB
LPLIDKHMLRRAVALAALSGTVLLAHGQAQESPATPDAGASYGIGLTFGNQLRGAGVAQQLDLDAVTRGLKDGLAGQALTDADRERTLGFMRAGREAVASHNRAAAAAFMARNGAINGVVTAASGLQYTIIEPGNAKQASPRSNDRVTVQYRSRLLDGTEFDSSDRHGQPATLALSGVIKGWREALVMMKPGAQWRLFVPPELAYGDNPPPPIPPGSMLVFDVELMKVEPPGPMPGPSEKGKISVKPSAGGNRPASAPGT